MLKVNNNGVTITLTGTSTLDSTFMFATVLLILAIGVVIAMSLFSVKASIGALTLLVVGCFGFNKFRQKQDTVKSITSGQLNVQKGVITHIHMRKQHHILVDTEDRIEQQGTTLTVYDAKNQKKCLVSSFESAKEAEVMKKVLQGQKMGKRNANISMKSS